MKKKSSESIYTLILSMLIFGSVGIFRRYIPMASYTIACFRGLCGAVVLAAAAGLQKRKLINHIGRAKVLLLIISGVTMGFNWILLFESYNYTTVATATLCYYMEPTIVVLLSPLFFRERITRKKGLCALIAVIGMVFVSGIIDGGFATGSSLSASEVKGILFGLSAAALYATVVIMNKRMPGIDAYEKTMIQLASAGLILIPYVLVKGVSLTGAMTPLAIAMLLILGFIHTGLTYSMYFGSIDRLPAQTVALVSYLDPISALVLSALILHERMTLYGILGACMIIGAAVCSEITISNSQRS